MLRLYELASVIDSVGVKEIVTAKDMRIVMNLVKDLREACKDYT